MLYYVALLFCRMVKFKLSSSATEFESRFTMMYKWQCIVKRMVVVWLIVATAFSSRYLIFMIIPGVFYEQVKGSNPSK